MPQHVEMIQKISECFRIKAEDFSAFGGDEEIASYFAGREEILVQIKTKKNQIVFGRKGTGKSMILKFLSLPCQYYYDPTRIEFAGFYCRLTDFIPRLKFDPFENLDVVQLMGHWFNLFMAAKIVAELEFMQGKGILGMNEKTQKEVIKDIWDSFFGLRIKDVSSNCNEVVKYFDTQQRKLKVYLERSHFSRLEKESLLKNYSKETGYAGELKSIKTFPYLTEIFHKAVPGLEGKPKSIFILLDEYEKFDYSQQTVINSIIGDFPFFVVKFGCLHVEEVKSRINLDGIKIRDDELPKVSLEFDTIEHYTNFAKVVLKNIFAQVSKKLTAYPEVRGLFGDPDKLLPGKSVELQLSELGIKAATLFQQSELYLGEPKITRSCWKNLVSNDISQYKSLLTSEKLPVYSGIDTISLLTFGFIRYMIEVVHRIIIMSLQKEFDLVIKQASIPFDCQDMAIRSEAIGWKKDKVKSLIVGKSEDGASFADLVMEFLNNLQKKFEDSLSKSDNPSINAFYISEVQDPNHDFIKAIEEAEIVGMFTEIDDPNFISVGSRVFVVLGIYSVIYNAPTMVTRPVRFEWVGFKKMFGHFYGRPGKKLQKEMLLEEEHARVFLGIGFREEWERKVRETVRSVLGDRLLTGEGAHSETVLLVETVKTRLNAADYCVFDVTYPNENVIFEYGFAITRRKKCYFIRNIKKKEEMERKIKEKIFGENKEEVHKQTGIYIDELVNADKVRFLEGAVWKPYTFSEVPTTEEDASLKSLFVELDDSYKKMVASAGKKEGCPLKARCIITPMTKAILGRAKSLVFFHIPDSAPFLRWFNDMKDQVSQEINIEVYPIAPSLVGLPYPVGSDDKHALICPVCRGIGRSRFCIIDTSNKEWTSCGILGFAFGMERSVLNVYNKESGGLITNWQGKLSFPYETKDQLLKIIKNFLQA